MGKGKTKIPIVKIEDPKRLKVTFANRKRGIMKTADELSVLCDSEIALIIFDNKNRLYQYSSSEMGNILNRYNLHREPQESKTNKDFRGDKEALKKDNDNAMELDQSGSDDINNNQTMSPEEIAQNNWIPRKIRRDYERVFDQMGPVNGRVTKNAVMEILWLTTNIKPPVLCRLWELCDFDNDGFLNRDKFSLTMHLVNSILNGGELPEMLTMDLVPPSMMGAFNNE